MGWANKFNLIKFKLNPLENRWISVARQAKVVLVRLEIVLVKRTDLAEMYWRYKYKKFEVNFIIVRYLVQSPDCSLENLKLETTDASVF